MQVEHSGYLLIRIPRPHYTALSASGFEFGRGAFGGLSTRPLFRSRSAPFGLLGTHLPEDDQKDWLLHQPLPQPEKHPWDIAHEHVRGEVPGSAALAALRGAYVEPDILHDRGVVQPSHLLAAQALPGNPPYAPLTQNLVKVFGPSPPEKCSPAWHLESGYSNFVGAWNYGKGAGVRIAHVDTGCYPSHQATPRNLLKEQGYNYCDDNTNVVDPLVHRPWDNPGHGPATLTLLAGNRMNLQFDPGWPAYSGDLGGAPDASVVPVRISNSVVHLYTSNVAQGLHHALTPLDGPPCDVVSLSHGGLPSQAWADAVNDLYEAGIVVVAASGDSYYAVATTVATHYTVYPSAFYRVITATGVTYDQKPYQTNNVGTMQGCWGPDKVMKKAVAAYTPNVPWIKCDPNNDHGWEMNGAGTSASTPQIAAACALWLAAYGRQFPAGWKRVQACRHALFESAKTRGADLSNIGVGILDAGAMLSPSTLSKVQAAYQGNQLPYIERDRVSWPFWRLLLGFAPPGDGVDEMYETEAAQIFYRSVNKDLAEAVAAYDSDSGLAPASLGRLRKDFIDEPSISKSLREYLRTTASA